MNEELDSEFEKILLCSSDEERDVSHIMVHESTLPPIVESATGQTTVKPGTVSSVVSEDEDYGHRQLTQDSLSSLPTFQESVTGQTSVKPGTDSPIADEPMQDCFVNEDKGLQIQGKPLCNTALPHASSTLGPENTGQALIIPGVANLVDGQPVAGSSAIKPVKAKKMSGGHRKKLAKLKQKGKRPRSDGSSPGLLEGEAKRVKTTSYSDVVKNSLYKIFIINKNHLMGEMEKEQAYLVTGALMKALTGFSSSSGDKVPTFNNLSTIRGRICLDCSDELSLNWIRNTISILKPWEGANLTAVVEGDLPRAIEASMFLPTYVGLDGLEALQLLARQNPDIGAHEWKITGQGKQQELGQVIYLSLAEVSLNLLEAVQFRPFLGLSRIFINVKGSKNKNSE